MKQIYPNLYIGSQADYESNAFDLTEWSIVFAARDPWHRRALGYTTKGAPKDHPNYLYLFAGNNLILNLVDADNPDYINAEVIDTAIDFIDSQLAINKKVAIFCNKGQSRSAGIGLLYLAFRGLYTYGIDKEPIPYDKTAEMYKRCVYEDFNPSKGMEEYMRRNWDKYVGQMEE